ncbi:MAG TPA: Clp protease N-terminal domain-containing protein [Terriglobales bacterium]|nr:Clp protease N-terminal domain-containing protein [Terriglobales bacterium]
MFERYSEGARRAIFFARYEASQFGSSHIETEHLLLALMRENKTLGNVWLTPEGARNIRLKIESAGKNQKKISTSVDLPLSSECKQVLSNAAEQADHHSNSYIGTCHLLLGLLSQQSCLAAQLLTQYGITAEQIQGLQETTSEQPYKATNFEKATTLELAGSDLSSKHKQGPTLMFQRYTEKARRVIFFARYEASRFGLPQIGSEHLLLALLREDHALMYGLMSPEDGEIIRSAIESIYEEKKNTSGDLPLTPECKQVLNNAAKQADQLSDPHIGTQHLLLGLLSQKSFAAELLTQRGVTAEKVLQTLKKYPSAERLKTERRKTSPPSNPPWAWPDAT